MEEEIQPEPIPKKYMVGRPHHQCLGQLFTVREEVADSSALALESASDQQYRIMVASWIRILFESAYVR